MKKRSVSPVIATVLLIMIVIILALIIFLWAIKFIGEAVTKKGAPADQKCGEVSLDVSYVDSELQITNKGSVPVYRLEVRARSEGSKDVSTSEGISIGDSKIIDIGSGYEEVEVIPVILGETEKAKKAYTCKDNIFIAE